MLPAFRSLQRKINTISVAGDSLRASICSNLARTTPSDIIVHDRYDSTTSIFTQGSKMTSSANGSITFATSAIPGGAFAKEKKCTIDYGTKSAIGNSVRWGTFASDSGEVNRGDLGKIVADGFLKEPQKMAAEIARNLGSLDRYGVERNMLGLSKVTVFATWNMNHCNLTKEMLGRKQRLRLFSWFFLPGGVYVWSAAYSCFRSLLISALSAVDTIPTAEKSIAASSASARRYASAIFDNADQQTPKGLLDKCVANACGKVDVFDSISHENSVHGYAPGHAIQWTHHTPSWDAFLNLPSVVQTSIGFLWGY